MGLRVPSSNAFSQTEDVGCAYLGCVADVGVREEGLAAQSDVAQVEEDGREPVRAAARRVDAPAVPRAGGAQQLLDVVAAVSRSARFAGRGSVLRATSAAASSAVEIARSPRPIQARPAPPQRQPCARSLYLSRVRNARTMNGTANA